MNFQVTVRDGHGRMLGKAGLENYIINNEEYYRKTRIIDQRLFQEFEKRNRTINRIKSQEIE